MKVAETSRTYVFYINYIQVSNIDYSELLTQVKLIVRRENARFVNRRIFECRSSKTNLETIAPLNRVLKTYYNIYKDVDIDLFSDNKPAYKKNSLNKLIIIIVCLVNFYLMLISI